jgi:hypothetical protein
MLWGRRTILRALGTGLRSPIASSGATDADIAALANFAAAK